MRQWLDSVKPLSNSNVKLIKQQDDFGCAVATIAMVLGKSYEEIREEVRLYWQVFRRYEPYRGMGIEEERVILYKFGYEIMEIRPLKEHSPEGWKELLEDMPAILHVNSQNVEGYGHSIYWDGKNIFDPSRLKTYNNETAFQNLVGACVVNPIMPFHSLFGICGEDDPKET